MFLKGLNKPFPMKSFSLYFFLDFNHLRIFMYLISLLILISLRILITHLN